MPDHKVYYLGTDTPVQVTWQGTAFAEEPWRAGQTSFLPGGSEISSIARLPYTAAAVSFSDDWFGEAVIGDINHNRIDYRFTKLPDGPVGNIVQSMVTLTSTPGFHWPALIESLSVSLAASVMAGLAVAGATVLPDKNAMSRERKQRVLEFIDSNLERKLTLMDMAKVASLSQYHFNRSFRSTFGITPLRYLAQRRVNKCKKMLIGSRESLAAIAEANGFYSQSHFTTCFKMVTGRTPGQFRKAGN